MAKMLSSFDKKHNVMTPVFVSLHFFMAPNYSSSMVTKLKANILATHMVHDTLLFSILDF